jgi:hypothetical protein
VFEAKENIVCTLKWPSLIVKIGKTKKSKFGRIYFKRKRCGLETTQFEDCCAKKHS